MGQPQSGIAIITHETPDAQSGVFLYEGIILAGLVNFTKCRKITRLDVFKMFSNEYTSGTIGKEI